MYSFGFFERKIISFATKSVFLSTLLQYLKCEFKEGVFQCQTCSFDYYNNLPKLKGKEILDIRNRLSEKFAIFISSLVEKSQYFLDYMLKLLVMALLRTNLKSLLSLMMRLL